MTERIQCQRLKVARNLHQFIESEADLSQRMDQRDLHPDPDGRYRINEFFCRQDTWQMTMRRLAASSSVTAMDLRSFSLSQKWQKIVIPLGLDSP